MVDHAGLLIASMTEQMMNLEKTDGWPPASKPDSPGSIVRFSSRQQMEIWLFCSRVEMPILRWRDLHKSFSGKQPSRAWLKKPEVIALDESGQIPVEEFKRINSGLSSEQCQSGACRICWGTGFAFVMHGILLSDITNIPGRFVATPCWCRKEEEK